MTALPVPQTPAAAVPQPRGRIRNVIRLQFVNKNTFLWAPLIVLGGAWIITLLIFWLIQATGETDVKAGGGTQAPLWYFMAVGIQAMTMTFPFSQALSVTRREFYLGTLSAAAITSAVLSVVFVGLGLVEVATGGYGINGYFAHLDWVWVHGPLAAGLTYFTIAMFAFVLGFWGATVFKRLGIAWLMTLILAVVLVLVGIVAVITLSHSWPDVWTWVLDTGSLGLTFWVLGLTVVLAGGSYLTLRGMPA